MSDYTPTTEAIRRGYSRVGGLSQQRKEAFDRWLAEVIRTAKAEAWEEGWKTSVDFYENPYDPYDNPYRQEETE